MPPLSKSQINGIKDYNLRTVLLSVYDQLDLHNQATGTNFIMPTNSPQKPASIPPSPPSITVSGANGIYTASVKAAPESVNKTIYFEVSYSTKANFTENVTTMAPTTATSVVIPSPGSTFYFRVRSSYNQSTWSNYAYA